MSGSSTSSTRTPHPAGDQARVLVEGSCAEELFEGRLLVEVPFNCGLVEPGEPSDDLVEFVLRAALLLSLGKVEGPRGSCNSRV